ncbi:MAG: hypothetical protein IT425_02680 [Pirellulales bacterium]|nr:hypothetical protein [Pirellulales bacterium]
MSEGVPLLPQRKKPSAYWWLGAATLLLGGLFLYLLFGPNPPIIVSPKTTYVTAPLGPNGLPNFARYYHEKHSQGVTSENNAAMLLFEVFGLRDSTAEETAAVADTLGVIEIPTQESILPPIYSPEMRRRVAAMMNQRGLLKLEGKPASEAVILQLLNEPSLPEGSEAELLSYEAEEYMDNVMYRPWKESDLPPLADWLHEHQAKIDKLVEASKRPKFYWPPASTDDDETLFAVVSLLPPTQNLRNAARILGPRAMLHLGEGRVDEAWQHILAIHRFGILSSAIRNLVSELTGIAIRGIAHDLTITLLGSEKLTAQQARQIERDLAALPSFSAADAYDVGERLFALDTVMSLAKSSDFTALENDYSKTPVTARLIASTSVDWNIVLRDTNLLHDRLTAVFSLPTRQQRMAAINLIDQRLQQGQADLESPTALFLSAFSRQRRSTALGGVVLGYTTGMTQAMADAQDRANAYIAMSRVAAALAVYRAEQGKYPATLAELPPGILPKLPPDEFSGKSFLYRRTNDGYLLTSVGPNGKDDGGSSYIPSVFEGYELDPIYENASPSNTPPPPEIPQQADDYSIRLPRQPRRTQ